MYYVENAGGSGKILLKDDAPVDKVIESLSAWFAEVRCMKDWKGQCGDGNELEIFQHSGRFYYSKALKALMNIEPFTVKGEIAMSGTDVDATWRYRFADGKWKEEQGYVLYEDINRGSGNIPVYTVLADGAPVKSFPNREKAESFCRLQAETLGKRASSFTVAETMLAM